MPVSFLFLSMLPFFRRLVLCVLLFFVWGSIGTTLAWPSINYSLPLPGTSVLQSKDNGWTTPGSNQVKDIITPEYVAEYVGSTTPQWCKRIRTGAITATYFIPTRTLTEWTGFVGHTPPGVIQISNCPVDAVCGPTGNTCRAGTPTGYSAPNCGGVQTWTCRGLNTGNNIACSAPNTPCPRPFITQWEVGNGNFGDGSRTIEFTIITAGPVTIDWGDGVIETKSAGTHGHTYATAGTKTVRITGPLRHFYNNLSLPTWWGNNDKFFGKLTAVVDWGETQWSSMRIMFRFATNLNSLPTTAPNLASVTDMQAMFMRASSFNQPIGNWNVSNVMYMNGMFGWATSFNQPLNNWNVSNVTDMHSMFSNASSFNQPIGNWNVSNVTDMQAMFMRASSFNQPIGNWNVSNVTDMQAMFIQATSFNQSLNNWNVSNVMYMNGMFGWATSFNQPLNNWNVSNVTDMHSMFSNASSFNQPIGNWNVSNVTDMRSMFSNATSFNQPIGNWNVSNVTDMRSMFSNATSFNQSLNNWNVGNVTSMHAMFFRASSFNQSLNNWNVGNVTSMHAMFRDASVFNQDIRNWNVRKVTDMHEMFYGATAFNQNIHTWCATQIPSKPLTYTVNNPPLPPHTIFGFDVNSHPGFINNPLKQPRWGCTTP